MSQALDQHHREFYDSQVWYMKWLGVSVLKYPNDLIVYQDIIHERKPELLIECGTYAGGSAWFFATIMDLVGCGRVITVDPFDHPPRPAHQRIEYILGSSTNQEIIARITQEARKCNRVMVVLDSDHHQCHVSREIDIYHSLVTLGDYLVVEDTNLNGHPVYPGFGPGPMEAVQIFLPKHPEFQPDKNRERFGLTANPLGWLKRV